MSTRWSDTSTKVELWIDASGAAQMRTHANEAIGFDVVTIHLLLMRDRLAQEIEAGPHVCPVAPEKVT